MNSATERIRRVVRLTPRERRLLLYAWWHLVLVDVALRFVPVTWLLPRAAPPPAGTSGLPLERIGWLLDVAKRHCPIRPTCLKEALVVARMLRTEGIDAAVRIGVARGDGGLRAHAWVEHRGRVVFGAADAGTYAELVAVREPPAAR